MDNEKIRHVAILNNLLSLLRQEVEEDVTRKQGLVKHDRFAPVFVYRSIARKGREKTFILTILLQLLFPPRSRMGDEPRQIAHAGSIVTIASSSSAQRISVNCFIPGDIGSTAVFGRF